MAPAGLVAAAAGAAVACAGLIVLLHPLLVRYALARPSARSSHRVPTPQGGGAAVIPAALGAGLALLAAGGVPLATAPVVSLCLGTLGLAGLGAVDDIRPLPPLPRLLVQAGCVALLLWGADPPALLPVMPPLLERAVLLLAALWWVNLVNFMDGIDWMTCVGLGPLVAAIALFGAAGRVPWEAAALAGGLLGALLGFAPFNRPVARLFLGDVGSLPIGLLTGSMLLGLATSGGLVAALLLPLYYLADATLTLLRRLARGARVWEAHREHAYQRALARGLSVTAVIRRVLVLNLALAGLAAATLAWPGWTTDLAALAVGAGLVAATLRSFGGSDGPGVLFTERM